MKGNIEYRRRSLRLENHDYSSNGYYFITICVKNNMCLFGKIHKGKMCINDAGIMIQEIWEELKNKFGAKLHDYVVMPNHFHGMIEIVDNHVVANLRVRPEGVPGSTHRLTPTGGYYVENGKTIGEMMRWFKTITTNHYIKGVREKGWHEFYGKLWQRNYYEHVVRNEKSFQKIIKYIQNNPAKWQEDKLYNNNL